VNHQADNNTFGCHSTTKLFLLQESYIPTKNRNLNGSPISSNIEEIFLQHIEATLMKQLFDANNIAFYTRYVDDILLMYNSQHITPETINNYIN